jgi:hypothetical protein
MDFEKYTVETLNKMLLKAVSVEDFELAAQLRDVINHRGGHDNFMSFDTQTKIILDEMNFDKIRLVMEALDWRIFGSILSVETLKKNGFKLLKDVWELPEGYEICAIESGGLRAERSIYDGMKMLKLMFIVSSYAIDYDIVTMTYDEFYGND